MVCQRKQMAMQSIENQFDRMKASIASNHHANLISNGVKHSLNRLIMSI